MALEEMARNFEGNVTEFLPHQAPKSIACGEDERVVLNRAVGLTLTETPETYS